MLRKTLFSTLIASATVCTSADAAFVANFHENLISGNNALFVFGAEGTNGTINGNDGFNESFTIDDTGVFELSLGLSGREMAADGAVNGLSLFVDSSDPISGIALNRGRESTDQTVLLDTDGLSDDYFVLTTPGAFGSGSQFSVTAVENNTVVTINSPVAIAGNSAGSPFQVTLNKGESVFYESGAGGDLSGTRVSSTANIAVFAGAECTQVPIGTIACDHLISQQFGIENHSNEFQIVENFGGGADSDLVRVVASEDNTEVFFNGVLQGEINAGEVLEIDNVGEGVLTTSAPVMAGQFVRGQGGSRGVGDPAFAIIPGTDQLLSEYAYATPVGADAFAQNFLNIAIEESIADTLTLNGDLVDIGAFNLIDGLLFGNVAISSGFGTISASDVFLATIAGFSGFDSYFSSIATAFSAGASPTPPMTPIPLPAAGWLFLGALGGLAGFKRARGR